MRSRGKDWNAVLVKVNGEMIIKKSLFDFDFQSISLSGDKNYSVADEQL